MTILNFIVFLSVNNNNSVKGLCSCWESKCACIKAGKKIRKAMIILFVI